MKLNAKLAILQIEERRKQLQNDIERLISDFEEEIGIDVKSASSATKGVSPRIYVELINPFKTT